MHLHSGISMSLQAVHQRLNQRVQLGRQRGEGDDAPGHTALDPPLKGLALLLQQS